MAEQALYRKYRSGSFAEVIGQDHVVQTLTAAIASGRVSHAYLFTGPRGTGKTSVARLLARALNCTGNPKPCNACSNCLATLASNLDVVEMDAASNRSIDAIRDLRDKINLVPTQGAYKVYIIDEVHMLTTEAFNALLKTLEEPPSHIVFILATTEAHKLPDTIISRTQRFTFKPISHDHLVRHLATIAQGEGVVVEPAALAAIATAARGGFRDAISILDQLVATSIRPVTAALVDSLLGAVSTDHLLALSQAIANNQTGSALTLLAQLETDGAQAAHLATQLVDYWRTIMLIAAGAAPAPDPDLARLAASVGLIRAAQVVDSLIDIGRSPWPQLALEVALAQLTSAAVPTTPASATPTPSVLPPTAAASTAPAAAPSSPAQPTAPQPQPAVPSSAPSALKAELWPKVLVLIKSQNNSLAALLQMYPIDFGEGQVTIKPRFNFHRDLFLKPANRSVIESAAARVYGQTIRAHVRTEQTSSKASRHKPDPTAELVSSALEILGGEVID